MLSVTKRLFLGVSIAATAACLLPALAFAEMRNSETSATTTNAYVMPETEVWDMETAHGDKYRLYVSRPEGDAPDGGYPVLYVLDGNAMFAGFAEARRIQSVYNSGLDKMIVVAIGYPNNELYDGRRMDDFTPSIKNPELKALYKDYASGGRDDFLKFLLEQVRPEIANRYPVNEDRQSLFGHSLGGLFALHVLYSNPGAFHSIIAASPTIWWDDQFILAEERAYAERIKKNRLLGAASRVFIYTGELEETPVTVSDSIALGKRLETLSAYGLRSEYEILDGETHITVPSRAVTKTLRAAMQWP
ncbi:alpha/beta hydrolase [Hyphococcus sp. DH-69]|uniref:alpha/beta hydrolase n=1 Tax=Hyphococcus formosus TaxID=3143534 RepID=UPI00398ADA6D